MNNEKYISFTFCEFNMEHIVNGCWSNLFKSSLVNVVYAPDFVKKK